MHLPALWYGTRPALPLEGRSDVAAAFSLRRLRRAYAGPLVRVRRSGDDAEQDFGADAWALDWAAVAAFIGGGSGFVRTWYDQSGNARHAGQATAGSQPAIGLLGNGKAGLTFDGDRLTTGAFTLNRPWSVNLVHRIVAATGTFVVFDGNSADTGELFGGTGSDTAVLYAGASVGGGGITAAALPNGTRGAVGGTYTGGSGAFSLLEIDAAALLSALGTVGTGNPGGLTLGTGGGGSFAANVEIQEFVAFDTAHTAARLKADNAAMRAAWNF